MRILAIESSCDETAAAVVVDGRGVLSNVVYSQIELHRLYGGVVPEIASRKHMEKISAVVDLALREAELDKREIDAVAVTYAPGLIGALLTGISFAKAYAFGLGVPLIPIHHLRGHVAGNYLTHSKLEPPFLALVVSGGHSHIVQVRDYTDYTVVGRTRDDAAGEAFDKVARVLDIGYPGGPAVERAANDGDAGAFRFPAAYFEDCPFDFSFSGLKTSVINRVHKLRQAGEEVPIADIAASFDETVAQTLCRRFMAAAQATKAERLVLAGGVSANRRLREKVTVAAREAGLEIFLPELKYCTDNAAMIGAQAYFEYLQGHTAGFDLNGYATMDIGENYPAG